jgi:hypothetical protein
MRTDKTKESFELFRSINALWHSSAQDKESDLDLDEGSDSYAETLFDPIEIDIEI